MKKKDISFTNVVLSILFAILVYGLVEWSLPHFSKDATVLWMHLKSRVNLFVYFLVGCAMCFCIILECFDEKFK